MTDKEREVIGECLCAAADGPFFVDKSGHDPSWEFHTLFGLWHEEVSQIANSWPNVNESDEDVRLAISGAMGNLLGYPHGCDTQWPKWISVTREELHQVWKKWINTHKREKEPEQVRYDEEWYSQHMHRLKVTRPDAYQRTLAANAAHKESRGSS